MSKFSLKASLKLSAFDLKNNRRQIFGWSIAMFSIMFLYMILFPSMQDMVKMKMDAMPKELLELFGMGELSELGNFVNYFGMIFNIVLVAISIFAVTFSANLIYREEKTKTIEFLYSLELSRTEIFVSKLITAFVAVLAVLVSSAVATAICGAINGGETFVLADVMQIIKITGFTAVFFMSAALLLAGVTAKIGVSSIGSMVVLACYMLGYLSKLLEDKLGWLSNFSPFEVFAPEKALSLESGTQVALAVYFGLMVVFLFVGAFVYKRRDFNI